MALHESHKIVMGFPPAASGTSDYVSLKNWGHLTAILILDNATTVTGSAITINQAQDVAATGEKVLGITTGWRNIDTGASDALASFTITSSTFTTDTTNAKNLMYVLEIDADDLDVANGFDCVQIANASGVSTVLGIVYILGAPRYATVAADQPTAITD